MSNFYKIKKAFRGNYPRINDLDNALNDPYKPKTPQNGMGDELLRPGDQSSSGFGTDYYTDKQPPSGISAKDDLAIKPPYGSDTDGSDFEKNDHSPVMESSQGFFDNDSPLSRGRQVMDRLETVDRDNTKIGPFNQQNKTNDFFDNIRSRIN